jgi:hypothetical protein
MKSREIFVAILLVVALISAGTMGMRWLEGDAYQLHRPLIRSDID